MFILGFFMKKTLPSISSQIDEKIINKVIQKNFGVLAPYVYSFISNWLIRAYEHYRDIDKFIIIIYLINKDLVFFRKNGLKIDYETFYKDKTLEIEKINAKVGETVKFNNILLLNDDKSTEIGSPKVEGATVEAKLLDDVKDRTVLVFHKRRRKHSRKKNGHRQRHSKIQITKILAKGGKVIDEAKIAEKKKPIKEEKKVIKKEAKK